MTLKLTGGINKIQLDTIKWTKTMRKVMERRNREAIRAFIRATVAKVPVYTGMARSSIKYASGPFGPLAAWLNVSVPIDPVEQRSRREKFYSQGKSIQSGSQLGQYTVEMGPKKYNFSFNSDVPHYFTNEYIDVGISHTAPWQSFADGYRAYQNEFREGVVKNFPGLRPYVVVTGAWKGV